MDKKKMLSIATTGIAILTLTSSAFAAVSNPAAPTAPAAYHQHDHHKGSFATQELLTLLKVDSPTLHKELKAGKSLADIAAANGVSEQTVIDYFVKKSTERIQEKVKSGKITQEQANQKIAALPDKMKKLVEKKGGFGHHGMHKHGGALKVAASALGMTVDDLKSQLKSGKSIADVAAAQGKDKQQIIDMMVNQATQKIDKAVHAGKLTQEKADQIKAKLPDRIKNMVERKGFGHK